VPSICAFALTYNRSDLIDQCLAGIVKQTRPCDFIVVVDNGSADDTLKLLREKWSDRVIVHSLPRNIGAAGGYNAGMHCAYMTGADLIWTMDDDVVPEPEALERLLQARDTLAERNIDAPFLISLARTPSGAIIDAPDIEPGPNETWPELLEKGLLPINRSTFNSFLLPRATLEKYGLPLAQMFIWGEDTEFTKRITRDGPGYLVGHSRVLHVREVPGKLDIRTERDPVRIGYHRFLKRNRTYMLLRYGRRVAVFRQMVREATLILQLCARGQFDRAGIAASSTASPSSQWSRPSTARSISPACALMVRPPRRVPRRMLPPAPPRNGSRWNSAGRPRAGRHP
jgi:dTDP-4-dehydrorhamnose reductase